MPAPASAAVAAGVPALRAVTPQPKVEVSPWGVPGEDHKIWVQPIMKGQVIPQGPVNIGGSPGPYRVHMLLARPGYPITKEREHKFIDQIVGDSHIRIAKPLRERGPHDIEKMLIEVGGKKIRFEFLTNDEGFLGKIIAELDAANVEDAERQAYGEIAPFLSAWSLNMDIPVHVETIQVTDLTTHVNALRARTPHFEMNWGGGGGALPFFLEEFCQYASVYREGLNTNSTFYRFLCFFKAIESLITRRGREAKAKLVAGQSASRSYEVIPEKREDLLALLKRLYPWRGAWDEMALVHTFPKEVLGKKVTWIKEKYLYGIRCGIAHTLLERGELSMSLDKIEHMQEATKWLPLCRIIARWMLLNDFPRECSIGMK